MRYVELRLIGRLMPVVRDVVEEEIVDPTRDGVIALNYGAAALRGAVGGMSGIVLAVLLLLDWLFLLDSWGTPLDEIAIAIQGGCALGVFWCLVRVLGAEVTPTSRWALPRDLDLVWQAAGAIGLFWLLVTRWT
ncbi:hypothetical protein [Thalassiella azotivora]